MKPQDTGFIQAPVGNYVLKRQMWGLYNVQDLFRDHKLKNVSRKTLHPGTRD
jgi:hypothetical protein